MVKTRSQTEAESEPQAISSSSQATARPASARCTSTRTASSTSATTVARIAAETAHARHLAQLELEEKRAQMDFKRKIAEIELRAELASTNSRGSRSSSKDESVENWLREIDCQDKTAECPPPNQPIFEDKKPASIQPSQPVCADDSVARIARAIEALAGKHRSKVPTNLPSFDGKSALDYLTFKRAFDSTQASFSTMDNIIRLSHCLKGAAREAVGTLLATASHATQIMEVLGRRFGRPELIIVQEVNSIRSLPKLGNDFKDLSIFATRVRNCVEVAKLLDHHDHLRSPELFAALINKLPQLSRARWLDYAKLNWEGQNKVELFSDFLSREVDLVLQFGAVAETTGVHRERSHTVTESEANPDAESTNMHHAQIEPVPGHQTCAVSESRSVTTKLKKSSGTKQENKICPCCQTNHQLSLSSCDKFKHMTIDDRWFFIKENKICYRCLIPGAHNFKYCNKNKKCEIKNCNRKHNTLLHNPNYSGATFEENRRIESSTSSAERVTISTTAEHAESSLRPLLKVIPVTIFGPAGSADIFALMDDGSTATFLDMDIARKIGVEGPEGQVHLECVGGLSRNSVVRYVDFKIKGKFSPDTYEVHKARAIDNLGLEFGQTVTRANLSTYSHLADLNEELCYVDAKPSLVIGVDQWELILALEIRQGSKTQPVAIRTRLGWVVFGFSSSKTKLVDFMFHVRGYDTPDPRSELELLVKEQYKLDAIGIVKQEIRSTEDQRALKILSETARRLHSGRFEVRLLWKVDDPVVPNSFPLALARFESLEKQMARDPQYAARYRQNIHDTLNKGYAEKCTTLKSNSVSWYLPHFGVVNPNKPGKLRVVHDAAAKTREVSLNSLLLKGPDLLQSLLGILMRFREGKIALTADIKEMFPQIKIWEQDRDAQRFLWRDNPSSPIETYRMSSMIFGACSSPSTAIFIANLNASEYQDEFPDATQAINRDTYMDDYIGSVDDSQKAAHLASEIVEIHKRGGFTMRGWISNNPSALGLLPKELLSEVTLGEGDVDLRTPAFTRTLGLIWQPLSDVVGFNIGSKNLPNQATKRDVLAHVMRIYDPLGILGPLVVKGRILFQNLWRKGLAWDERLSEAELSSWEEWSEGLKGSVKLQIPRRYKLLERQVIELELHLFCDASELAHAAVAYWRFVFEGAQVSLALIASKARVSPLKPTSIPRLELQAALIGSRLADTICKAHRYKPHRRYFWSDSMTVLGWLRNDARNFKPFVSHRVGEIIETTNVDEWHWVPTELNVADDATRGKCKALNIESRWITGPSFLLSPTSEWPVEPQNLSNLSGAEELKPSCRPSSNPSPLSVETILCSSTHQLPSPVAVEAANHSSWTKLLKATAYFHMIIAKIFRNKSHRCFQNPLVGDIVRNFFNVQSSSTPATLSHIDAVAIQRAECHVLLNSQLASFKEEMLQMIRRQPLPKKSRLVTLSPKFDDRGLICLSGRITAAPGIEEELKRPVILDSKDPAVRLLIQHYHAKFAHANTETVLNELRQRYWILGVRSTTRVIVRRCQICKLLRAPTKQPPMGDLPVHRLEHHKKPFTNTGLDYFGPVTVSVGRRREKRWVALFTCLVTRAVHLEVAHTLSTDSAIMCLRRFAARRGNPNTIYSDNGTAFKGASRQLRALYGKDVQDFAATNEIRWHFIPPSAPFMGGAWERLVKSIKTALNVTLRQRTPSDEILNTILAEAEAIVNTRPLTHVSPDPDYPEALTPNHFLLGESSRRSILDDVELGDADLCGRNSWRKALRLADHFWRRWVREYLPSLAPRRVLGSPVSIKVGDLVLIADGDLPRGTWPRGVVEALYPGHDGVTRVVDVRTQAGTLRRPLKKLVLL